MLNMPDIAYEGLKLLECAISASGKRPQFDNDWNPELTHDEQYWIRDNQNGTLLRVSSSGSLIRVDTCYLSGGVKKMASVESELGADSSLPVAALGQRHLFPAVTVLANAILADCDPLTDFHRGI